MKRIVTICAVIGFLVPIFWGFMGFIAFTARPSPLVDFYWKAVHVTCPPWLIPDSSFVGSAIATPFLNAALYGGIAFVLYALVKLVKRTI